MLHGLLILDKPSGRTSAQVVEAVRRKLKVSKVGHTGTLDPLATGVLPIVVGRATKLAGYLIAEDKAYEAELELGVSTDTYDRDGAVVARAPEAADAVTDAALDATLEALRAKTAQLPPMFSAIKQAGVRLYERARAGEEVERAPRPVTIHRLERTWRRGRAVGLSVACSKGTFVRTLVDDLGCALGCGACVTALRRTQSGAHGLQGALTLDEVTPQAAAARLIPLSKMLSLPSVVLAPERRVELRDGRRDTLEEVTVGLVGVGQVVDPDGELLALVERGATGPQYLRVFPPDDP